MGHSDIFLKLEIIKKIIGLSVLCLFIYLFRTPIGIASTAAVTALISVVVNANPNRKLLNYGYLEQMKDIVPSYLLSISVGFVIYYMTTFPITPILQLLLFSSIGAVLYLIIAKILHLECLEYLLNLIKEFRNERK